MPGRQGVDQICREVDIISLTIKLGWWQSAGRLLAITWPSETVQLGVLVLPVFDS